jgi:hypothetical protein
LRLHQWHPFGQYVQHVSFKDALIADSSAKLFSLLAMSYVTTLTSTSASPKASVVESLRQFMIHDKQFLIQGQQ